MKYAIVAVGYNRPDSMKNLLDSLISAYYNIKDIDLIISIDKGEKQSEIIKVANEAKWNYGQKIIRPFEKRQGLRKHILQCGDLTYKYDAVVVLEDDLEVSKYYFNYVLQMIDKWSTDDRIAGISLYKHCIHPGVHRFFEPANAGHDIFLMQYAMSWGQCWTRRMWHDFKQWYIENENSDLSIGNIMPSYISSWNKHSWLKYYMRYTVEKNKYFIYPYISLSTNASDAGEHCSVPNNDFQVPLLEGEIDYRIPTFENAVRYDVYFERMDILPYLEKEYGRKVTLDLYGSRALLLSEGGLLFSSQSWPYKTIGEIGLKYRPIENNCLKPEQGKGIIVYDTSVKGTNKVDNVDVVTRYDVRSISWKRILHLGITMFKESLLQKVIKHKK